MKKLRILIVFLCLCGVFAMAGCGDKEVGSAKITRDDARVGGSLSFVYDQKEGLVTVGGKDEVVQYYAADEIKKLDAGCRIGLKVTAPDENLNIENAVLEMNGVVYSSGEFLENVDGQKQRFFNIYPVVSKEVPSVSFSIKWQDGTKKQTYKMVVENGTKFLNKNGEVEE